MSIKWHLRYSILKTKLFLFARVANPVKQIARNNGTLWPPLSIKSSPILASVDEHCFSRHSQHNPATFARNREGRLRLCQRRQQRNKRQGVSEGVFCVSESSSYVFLWYWIYANELPFLQTKSFTGLDRSMHRDTRINIAHRKLGLQMRTQDGSFAPFEFANWWARLTAFYLLSLQAAACDERDEPHHSNKFASRIMSKRMRRFGNDVLCHLTYGRLLLCNKASLVHGVCK